MSIRTINQLSFIFIRIFHLPTSTSGTFSCIEITSEDMCKIQPRLYLISSSDSNQFYPCKGKPNHTTYGHSRSPTWQPFMSSQSQFSMSYPYPRLLSTPTNTRLRADCFSSCSQSLSSYRGGRSDGHKTLRR